MIILIAITILILECRCNYVAITYRIKIFTCYIINACYVGIIYNGYNNKLYLELEDFLLSLGDEVSLFGCKNLITARKIRPFLFILNQENSITLFLNNEQYVINNIKELESHKNTIEMAYDEK